MTDDNALTPRQPLSATGRSFADSYGFLYASLIETLRARGYTVDEAEAAVKALVTKQAAATRDILESE